MRERRKRCLTLTAIRISWKKLEKFTWTNRVKNEVFHTHSKTNGICCIKYSKRRLTGFDILRRNCLLKHDVEEEIDRKRREKKRTIYPVDDFKEKKRF